MPAGAFVMRNASTTFDTTEYKQQLTRSELVPEAETSTLRTLDPDDVAQDVDTNAWTFEISGVQDWKVSRGLARFLHDNHGQEITVELQPRPGTGEAVATFTILGKSPNFGGSQGDWALMELSLPVKGQPVFSEAA